MNDDGGDEQYLTADSFALYVRHWDRARALAEVLDASLSLISERVEEGAYDSALSPDELVALLRALFQPSPNRSALIRLLQHR